MIVVNELVTNVLRHGPRRPVVRLLSTVDGVRVEVRDDSPQPPLPARGLGLALVEGLATSLGIVATARREVVWSRTPAAPREAPTKSVCAESRPVAATELCRCNRRRRVGSDGTAIDLPAARCQGVRRLRHLHARPDRARRELERRRRAHQGLHRRGDHRPALLASFYPPEDIAAGKPAWELRAGHRRGPTRGRGLARAQGRHPLLGQRRHHRALRRRPASCAASARSPAT